MATSSDNLIAASIDPFLLRHSFSDYFWPTPSDNDSLPKSIYDDHDFNFNTLLQQQSDHHFHQYLNHQQQSDLVTPSPDLETSTTPKRRTTTTTTTTNNNNNNNNNNNKNNNVTVLSGKTRITKRKSRATKKNQTTFITADPANFRQMVQQVTGIRFDSTTVSTSTLPPSISQFLNPEICRPVGRLYNACLPTLDTSSFVIDKSQSLISDRFTYGGGGLNSVGVAAPSGNGGESGYGASDGFACFPTLESWKVM